MARRNPYNRGKPIPVRVTDDTEETPIGAQDGTADPAAAAKAYAESGRPPDATSPGDFDAELKQIRDKWLRAEAELDNYRKRAARDVEQTRARERETILTAWLGVLDNIDRALGLDGAQNESSANPDNPWQQGMLALQQQMIEVMRRFGAEPFEALGEKFDPNLHEAVATADLPGEPEGKIVDVAQTGYILNGKVLRAAKVIPVKHT